ncbi:3-hydroxyacyl-ACP dehydratase FabZ [Teredinibacter turnerae]|uniref:3-hydroxyacyl-[acyl-carrier-protein] dehydratase FabZ n=1 Tax=Teredinibacter turnerae (strain ATCC 39867 / T7901) TaxID=377629 RepID=FABZ_TERTT|nr:3-hydroxyacyl-ACP dehydratase FabZ [Teredinibacter turnerae]C5BQG6.1 RecName: Full=3-hydroxyacyl-[acyl-carrier-protein] dehydratase FabZ; AltName: Full=(3R)-hydroxymyristoyl-[acyl-carrier-protein] dehydratase; Short=(3R)-hydroxymyristoyl-ACP dehydrase; AltName: Full=Beta-hydroxyacyl-ACP dehydratase [Teredinibacter turnerae T7901]ACR12022.1 beta-hydroxyacyl-(acyl-carrier-protein) dehydratase FabZ [Teredinibacter turnerae T7901]
MLDILEIRKYLPHRYPFLMIDRVVELIEGESITAYKNVSINEEIFQGHFPHFPVFPGVLLIEAMAQACGVLGFKTANKTPEDGSIYLFAGIDGVRFKRQVVPGDRVYFECKVVSAKRGIWKFDCVAKVDGELVTSATIMCADRVVG